jgi:hypothetical protein
MAKEHAVKDLDKRPTSFAFDHLQARVARVARSAKEADHKSQERKHEYFHSSAATFLLQLRTVHWKLTPPFFASLYIYILVFGRGRQISNSFNTT